MVTRILVSMALLLWGGLPAPAFGEGEGAERAVVNIVPHADTDHSHQQAIRGEVEVGGTDVWINQAVRIILRVVTDSPFVTLDAGDAQLDGFDILLQPQERQALEEGTEHRLGWVLYPQVSGDLSVSLPPVRYRRDGIVTHMIHLPTIRLQVRPLPVFVPPTMPVGRMVLHVSPPEGWYLETHKLDFLELRVGTAGRRDREPLELLRQLRSDASLVFYPPRDVTSEHAARNTGTSEAVYQVPFTPVAMGRVSLPSLRLQYFDPATGKIVTEHHVLGSRVSIARWVIQAGAAVLLLGLLVLARYLYRVIERKWRVFLAYRAALHDLRRAVTPGDIKAALMRIAVAESWRGHHTLQSWLHNWKSRYPGLPSLEQDMLRLQAMHYGRNHVDIEKPRSFLIDVCQQRMPLLKLSLNGND
jgi:hypothetical protein